MTGVQEQPKGMLGNVGCIPNLISEEHLFDSFLDCIKALEADNINPDPKEPKSIVWNLN